METLSLDQIATAIGQLKGEGEELLDALTSLVQQAFPKLPKKAGARRPPKVTQFHQNLMEHTEVIKRCLAACNEITDVKGIRWSIKFGQVTHWLIARPEGMTPPKTETKIVLCEGAPFSEEVHSLDTRKYMWALEESATPKKVPRRGRGQANSKLNAGRGPSHGKLKLNQLLESHGGDKGYPFNEVQKSPVGGFAALLRATRIRLWQKGDLDSLSKITPVGKNEYTHERRHREIWFKRPVVEDQTLPELLKGKEPCTLVLETSHCADMIELLKAHDLNVDRD